MTLPDRTLCWVTGPPWDRHCEPVVDDDTVDMAQALQNFTDALRPFAVLADRKSPLWAIIDECETACSALTVAQVLLDLGARS
jgi:hypothetical protein